MKKKGLIALAIAIVLSAVPVVAGAAGSVSGSGSGVVTSGGTSSTKPSVEVAPNGEKTTVVNKTEDKTGTVISLVVDTVNMSGQQIAVDAQGQAQVGDATVSIVVGGAETAGLPKEVVDQINSINSGAKPSTVLGSAELDNHVDTGASRAIVSKNAAGQDVKAEFTMKVSGLVDANEAAVMYYDNNTGKWAVAKVLKFNKNTGEVTFALPGSATVKFYKK